MRPFLHVSVLLATLGLSACATAPPTAPPAPAYEQKIGWIVRLEDQRVLRDEPPPVAPPAPRGRRVAVPPAPPPPDLVRLLSDADARIRRRAALAIGRVGLPDGVPALLAAIKDADPDVRQMVCFGLGLLRDGRAKDALVLALDDGDLRVQGRAAEALGSMGDVSAAAAVGAMVARHASDPAVASLAEDATEETLSPAAHAFRLGLAALVRLKAWEPLAAATLDGQGLPRRRWWPVAYALQRIEDARAVPALVAFAKGTGVDAVAFAARGLGALKARPGVDVLVPLLDTTRNDRRVVAVAARALGQIGDQAAADALLKLLRNTRLDAGTRVDVVMALGEMKARAAMDDVLDLVGDPLVALRGAALVAAASIDPDAFVVVLSGLDPDPAWQVRADLARALVSLGRERATGPLQALARDEDQRVVAAALRALGEVKAADLADVARERLSTDDLVVRATAATLVGELRPEGGAGWLREAWARATSDTSYVARAAALVALTKFGLDASRPTLEEALDDPDWAVRLRAMQLLRELDPAADVSRARPAPTRRAPAEYEAPALVAPSYSPLVYLDTDKGTVEIELLVLDAPLTCANFVELARKEFFNGLPVHRVVPNFVVQDGDPRGDGEGGPGYTIRDEINDRPYLRGTVGMALDWADTGGSQYFITHGPQPHLDARYTVFGRVVNGMDVVDRLERWDVVRRVRVWDGVQAPTQ